MDNNYEHNFAISSKLTDVECQRIKTISEKKKQGQGIYFEISDICMNSVTQVDESETNGDPIHIIPTKIRYHSAFLCSCPNEYTVQRISKPTLDDWSPRNCQLDDWPRDLRHITPVLDLHHIHI